MQKRLEKEEFSPPELDFLNGKGAEPIGQGRAGVLYWAEGTLGADRRRAVGRPVEVGVCNGVERRRESEEEVAEGTDVEKATIWRARNTLPITCHCGLRKPGALSSNSAPA